MTPSRHTTDVRNSSTELKLQGEHLRTGTAKEGGCLKITCIYFLTLPGRTSKHFTLLPSTNDSFVWVVKTRVLKDQCVKGC